MNRRSGLAVSVLLLAGIAMSATARDEAGQTDPQPVPQGEPVHGGVVEDRDFGVRTTRFGLDRRVEMLQWQHEGEGRYEQVWKPALVDSSGFAPGHDNPAAFPLENRRWWAGQVSLDGSPLDPAVVKALGQWQEFRPGFTRLPANLAATFQPEGDGLGSSINPLDPQTGDLRIRWRELHLPPLAGRVHLRDGQWRLSPAAEQAALSATPLPPPDTDAPIGQMDSRRTWLVAGVLLLVTAVGGWLIARRRRR